MFHKVLLLRLQQVGIGGTGLKWLHHFLTERELEVTFSGKVQPESDMHTQFVSNEGVPKEVYWVLSYVCVWLARRCSNKWSLVAFVCE